MQIFMQNKLFPIIFLVFLFLGLGIFFQKKTFAQNNPVNIPLGSWRTHFNYNNAYHVANGNGKSYVATQNGFFVMDWANNEMNTLSKIEGFSGGEISALGFDDTSKNLLIAYQNSEIDILNENTQNNNQSTLKNITLLRDLNTANSKKINEISFFGNNAYLSTDFGVVIIDLRRQEIKETYQNLGAIGTNLAVFSVVIFENKMFLATAQGIIMGNLNDNLKDFNLWTRFSPTLGNIPAQNTLKLQLLNNKLYAWQNGAGLFQYISNPNGWQLINTPNITLNNFQKSNEKLYLLENIGRIWSIDAQNNASLENIPLVKSPQSLTGQGGKLYIADVGAGFLSNHEGEWRKYAPNGLITANVGRIYYQNEQILATTRGFNTFFNANIDALGVDFFKNGQWTSNNFSQNPALSLIKDVSGITYQNQERNYYISTFGKGIITLKADNSTEIINQTTQNTTLTPDANGNLNITDITTDRNGDIVVLQSGNIARNLHIRRKDNTWIAFPAPNQAGFQAQKIFIDRQNNKWIALNPAFGGGAWVVDDRQNRQRILSTQANQGGFPDVSLNTIAQDADNQIWVGTNKGVAVLSNASRLFDGNINFFTPVFENRPLLRNEKIKTINIDGGNRKWIGTENGIWLFNAEVSEVLAYFNAKNSPLPNDNILDVSIENTTGEVFILTDAGLVSYRSNATQAEQDFGSVNIFPNPVRPDFIGMVGINGLAENSTLKIVDSAGRLFYETKANGGTASWNLRDYNNVLAETGIYFVYCTDAQGGTSVVKKIAVVK